MKIVEARKIIGAYLKSIHPRVYYEEADEKAPFPYLVFDFPNSYDDGVMENFRLEIDGWDAPADGDTTAIETLMHAVDGGLHDRLFRIPGMALIVYRENRMSLKDDDKKIRRRKYIYQVRTYGG